MATLDWHCWQHAGVTFVELLVTCEVTERIRIESELTPVWPPRREGVPLEGWDERGYEGVVSADTRTLLGYATPAEPTDPPASLTTVSSSTADTEGSAARALRRGNLDGSEEHSEPGAVTPSPAGDHRLSPEALVRTLGRAAPPRDAVPPARQPDSPDPTTGVEGRGRDPAPDDSVEEWLDSVETRLETVEKLGEATTIAGIRSGVEDVENAQAVPDRVRSLERDARVLGRLSRRSATLRDRIQAVDVPVNSLERTT